MQIATTTTERSARWSPSASRLGQPLGVLLRAAFQLALVVVAYGAYRLVRILTDSSRVRAMRNADVVLDVERWFALDWERGIQRLSLGHRGFIDACNAVYTYGYWPTVIGALVVLYFADRHRYVLYRNALFVSGGIGLVVFAVFPLAPPRMLPGYVDTIVAFSNDDSFAHPTQFTNPYAAMPSFHVGWTVLAGLAVMPLVRHRVARALMLLPGVAMSTVVVVTANHYILDGIAGVGVAILGLRVAPRLCRRSPAEHEILDVATQHAYPARHYARPGVPRGG